MLEISTIAWMALLLEVMSETALVESSKKLNKLRGHSLKIQFFFKKK
jgi:hypothetical protein